MQQEWVRQRYEINIQQWCTFRSWFKKVRCFTILRVCIDCAMCLYCLCLSMLFPIDVAASKWSNAKESHTLQYFRSYFLFDRFNSNDVLYSPKRIKFNLLISSFLVFEINLFGKCSTDSVWMMLLVSTLFFFVVFISFWYCQRSIYSHGYMLRIPQYSQVRKFTKILSNHKNYIYIYIGFMLIFRVNNLSFQIKKRALNALFRQFEQKRSRTLAPHLKNRLFCIKL